MVLLVGDGMADRPVKALNNRTPLEVATTPNMDEMARRGIVGPAFVIRPGLPPGSDTAHIALFGLDPFEWYEGRGPFEALGVGAELSRGDVAFRGNFATVREEGDKLIVIDRRAGRIKGEEAEELTKALNENIKKIEDVEVRFYHATEHRLAVVFRGSGLSDRVTDTDPHEVNEPVLKAKPLTKEAEKTARIMNEVTMRSYKILKEHPVNKRREAEGKPPANIVLLRGAGMYRKELPKLRDLFGVKAACVSATALIKGVARAVGMDVYTPPGATGGVDTDYKAKAREAVKLLKDYDFVFVHLKGTDAASHDGNVEAKIKMIEALDYILGYIWDHYPDAVFVVTADHATPLEVKEHTGDPVPYLLYAPQIIPNDVVEFNERQAIKGLQIRGYDVLQLMLNYANRAKKYGA